MRSTTAFTASSWPITRAEKCARMAERSSRSVLSRMDVGSPVCCDRVTITSCGEMCRDLDFASRAAVCLMRSSGPGHAGGAQVLPGTRDGHLDACGIDRHVAGDLGAQLMGKCRRILDVHRSSRTTSKALRRLGLNRSRRDIPAGDVSVQMMSRPEVTAGMT